MSVTGDVSGAYENIISSGALTNNEEATNSQPAIDTLNIGTIIDPPTAIKTFDDADLPQLEFQMVWINSSNASAIDVQVTDAIPAGTTYVANSITCDPRGSSSNAVAASSPLSGTAVPNSYCGYDAGNDLIQWQGTIGPDDGNLTEATAANEVVITFRITVDDAVNQVSNQGFARTDVDSDTNFDEETVLGVSLVSSNQVVWNRNPSGGNPTILPSTGFAPGRVTSLPEQTKEQAYTALGDLWLEVPALGVKTNIVGVPKVQGGWNVDWLSNQTGWLQGTAFPTWQGNSVLTGHVYLSNGLPGPFVDLTNLRWGDQVIVHAFGQRYTYEVRSNRVVMPTDLSPLQHEDRAWLTLLTCRSYDESSAAYRYRIATRAVLIKVEAE